MRYEFIRDYRKHKIGNILILDENDPTAFDLVNNGIAIPLEENEAPKVEKKKVAKKKAKKKASKKA